MVSLIGADPTVGSGLDLDAATTSLTYSLKIGNGTLTNCRFYASMYQFTPQTESLYISAPDRKILYNNVVQYGCVAKYSTESKRQLANHQWYKSSEGFLDGFHYQCK